MSIKELAEKIGCHRRTIYKMSKVRQQQWQSLAEKGRNLAWFDLLSMLIFEVECFNAKQSPSERLVFELCQSVASVTHYDIDFKLLKSFWSCDVDMLTESLQYVRNLNNAK